MMVVFLTTLLGCTSSPPIQAPPPMAPSDPQIEDISALLKDIRERHGVPALAAAIVEADGVTAMGAVGLRRNDRASGARPDDPFHLGSDTKAMTATLLAVLSKDHDIGLDTTLADVFPDVEMATAWRQVTIEQLLHHRGGASKNLLEQHPALWAGLWSRNNDSQGARAWFAGELLRQPPDTEPGGFAYSNAGYMLVGAAMESVTGQSWETLMQKRLFDPLGMSGCGFGAPRGEAPWGHQSGKSGRLTPVDPNGMVSDNPTGLGPAGTVHCPMIDWGRFLSLHLRRGAGALGLTDADFERMHAPVGEEAYAHGWGVVERPWADGPILTHAGSNTMWFAVTWLSPEDGRGYLAVSNVANGEATNEAIGALIGDE
ncbi:MAG: serine hydrolase domain-containing protein [Myxococcota bacterium]